MLSISWNVRLCVRLSLCVSVCLFLRYQLNVFLPPISEVKCPKIFEIRNPWGKVVDEVVSDLNIFAQEMVLNCCGGKGFFYHFFFFICLLLRYCLNVFFPPLLKVGCPKFLELRNPWEKILERNGLRFEHFCSKMVQNCCGHKKKKK